MTPDPPPAVPAPNRDRTAIRRRARLTSGADTWTTHADPETGQRALRMSDGPNGVRGPDLDERQPSRCTPCGTALAASWDVAAMTQVGRLVAGEARRQRVDVVLGPTLNIHRSPLGGRGFECYSEDPLLSGRMAAGWIAGVQSLGVAACPKHFVANDSETGRTRLDCRVDERALRELYLVPFEEAVRSGAWAVMAAYNKVNGVFATEHRALLRDILKDEWGWDGVVVSDWSAARDTVCCALAGLDLEMPGPGRTFGSRLARAVEEGLVPVAVLDEQVERIRRLTRRVGGAAPSTGDPHRLPHATADPPPQRVLVEAAAAGFVLLKNSRGLLPLRSGPPGRTLALIGPNAAEPCLQGGGSAAVAIGSGRSLAAVLQEQLHASFTVRTEQGCANPAVFPGLHQLPVRPDAATAEAGLTVEYVPDPQNGYPAHREIRRASRLGWFDGVPGLAGAGWVRVSGVLHPPVSGRYAFTVHGSGATRLLVDGREVATMRELARDDDPAAAWYSDERGVGGADLRVGTSALIQVEMRHRPVGQTLPLLEYGCRPPEPPDLMDRAVSAARAADVVVLVVGTGQLAESESTDRTTTALPGGQDELVRAVLAANRNTVVVVNAGAAVALPWADDAAAILYSWFPGDGFAEALAAVLTGDLEPGGRLPITLARDDRQYPAFDTTPDADDALRYTESVFVGYRHFDAAGEQPAFCFGHGLGYTDFRYEYLTLSADRLRAGEGVEVRVLVRNVGQRSGKEVVQLYVSPPAGAVPRPPRELRAFAALRLAPGDADEVTFRLGARAFAYWDVGDHGWRVPGGVFGIEVGRSSRDLRLTARLEVA